MSHRTFLAIELSKDVRSGVGDVISLLTTGPANVKWVEPDNLHLTLKFFGDVTDQDVARICTAVGGATPAQAPFSCTYAGLGAFPHVGRPRTLWAGVAQGREELIALYDVLDQCLSPLGFPREHRRFSPHLTIGRTRGGGDTRPLSASLRELADVSFGTMSVSCVTLFSSQLRPSGPVYTSLGRFHLTGA